MSDSHDQSRDLRCLRGVHGSRRRRCGSSLVETSLALLVLLPLTFGAIEWSYVMYVKNTIQAAAREAARQAIVPTATQTTARNRARAVLESAFGAQRAAQFDIEFPTWGANSGDEIKVRVVAPQWHVFGVRPLGTMVGWWPASTQPAPPANKRYEAFAVMYKE